MCFGRRLVYSLACAGICEPSGETVGRVFIQSFQWIRHAERGKETIAHILSCIFNVDNCFDLYRQANGRVCMRARMCLYVCVNEYLHITQCPTNIVECAYELQYNIQLAWNRTYASYHCDDFKSVSFYSFKIPFSIVRVVFHTLGSLSLFFFFCLFWLLFFGLFRCYKRNIHTNFVFLQKKKQHPKHKISE